MIAKFAVIGNPIAHSLSPLIHHYFAGQADKNIHYEKILGSDSEFEEQVLNFFYAQGKGLNVTLPFKERAFNLAKHVTRRCKQAKAANTLWMINEELYADNTDGFGLVRDLELEFSLKNKQILILGAGGAARGIIGPLFESNVKKIVITNRTSAKAQALVNDFPQLIYKEAKDLAPEFDLIINATSASLTQTALFLPNQILQNQPFCYDLAYDLKQETPFVNFAKQQGCIAKDGLGMLIEQAAEAFSIWHQFKPDTKDIHAYLIKKI